MCGKNNNNNNNAGCKYRQTHYIIVGIKGHKYETYKLDGYHIASGFVFLVYLHDD